MSLLLLFSKKIIIAPGVSFLSDTGSGDIKFFWDSSLMEGDYKITGSDLELDDGIVSAVLISLHSNRRASDDDILPDLDNNDKQGWWGDTLQKIGGDQIGSKLWLLSRAVTSKENLRAAEEYARESLQWMIDDGKATDINVVGIKIGPIEALRLGLEITITLVTDNIVSVNLENINIT